MFLDHGEWTERKCGSAHSRVGLGGLEVDVVGEVLDAALRLLKAVGSNLLESQDIEQHLEHFFVDLIAVDDELRDPMGRLEVLCIVWQNREPDMTSTWNEAQEGLQRVARAFEIFFEFLEHTPLVRVELGNSTTVLDIHGRSIEIVEIAHVGITFSLSNRKPASSLERIHCFVCVHTGWYIREDL